MLVALLVLIPSAARAEQIECWSTIFDTTTEYVYRIDAARDRVTVSTEYKPTGQQAYEAEIISFWNATSEGPLGVTSIYLRQRENSGLLPPSLVVGSLHSAKEDQWNCLPNCASPDLPFSWKMSPNPTATSAPLMT